MQENQITVVAAVICHNKKILIARRGPYQKGAGDWEFPGGKVEAGEDHHSALKREIKEELNLHILPHELIGESQVQAGSRIIRIFAYWADLVGGELTLLDHDDYRWESPANFEKYLFSRADVDFFAAIAVRLQL